MATPNRQYPAKDLSVEELVEQVRRAAVYVAESEERYNFMTKSSATLFDELKVARRTLAQAETNLLVASKKAPGQIPVLRSVSTPTEIPVKVSK